MASFCTKCGSSLDENQKFCPKCGSPQGDTATPPQPAAAVSPTLAPVSTAAAQTATAPKKGSPVVKIILVVVGIFVFIGVAGMGTCVYLGYKAKQKISAMADEARRGNMGTPEIHIDSGDEGSTAASSATQDVPAYPGATATETGGGLSFGGQGGISSQEYETTDTVQQVLDYYKENLGSKMTVMESEGNATFTYGTSTSLTTVTITRDEDSGNTKITYARVGK